MAGWFAELKSLVTGVDLSGMKSVDTNLVSGNRNSPLISLGKVEDNSKHVHVDINIGSKELDDPEKLKLVQSIVKEATLEDKQHPLLESTVSSTVKAIPGVTENSELVQYFTGKIPSSDIQALRSAVYMRSLYVEGQSVDEMKHDIMSRFGPRGANIANLCTAGYFESHIRPMYEEFKQRPNFTPQLFIEHYNILVEGAPFAVFIGRNKSSEDLVNEVEHKISTNKSYGIKQLNLHAIGAENVKKLHKVIGDERISKFFTSSPAINIDGHVMNAQIFF